jgi:hypothetical protein
MATTNELTTGHARGQLTTAELVACADAVLAESRGLLDTLRQRLHRNRAMRNRSAGLRLECHRLRLEWRSQGSQAGFPAP